jgi:hypothetical protein
MMIMMNRLRVPKGEEKTREKRGLLPQQKKQTSLSVATHRYRCYYSALVVGMGLGELRGEGTSDEFIGPVQCCTVEKWQVRSERTEGRERVERPTVFCSARGSFR